MFSKKDNSDEGIQASYDRQLERNWKLVEKIVSESFNEQKRARRWGIFFKLATVAYLFLLLLMFSGGQGGGEGMFADKKSAKHTAIIRIEGEIMPDAPAGADAVVSGLRDAFENENSIAVIMRINSPGGSPVQAGHIYDEVLRLRAKYPEKKVFAVIDDLGASGAYYIAASAAEIWADRASLVGSIGVTASTFGFVETLQKVGVERRLFTSGEHKAFLDPFLPLKESERDFWAGVLQVTHNQFISKVREGRGARLKEQENKDIFSGLIWSGEQSLEIGLIDGLGSAGYVAREIIGEEELVDYTYEPSPFEQFTKKLGVSIGNGIAQFMATQAQIPALK